MGKNSCNVENALAIIGGKWSTIIVRDLLSGPKRFKDLRKSISGVSPNSLTKTLRGLESHSVINREIFPEIPPRVEYSLTPYGMKLENVIGALAEWGSLEPPKIRVGQI